MATQDQIPQARHEALAKAGATVESLARDEARLDEACNRVIDFLPLPIRLLGRKPIRLALRSLVQAANAAGGSAPKAEGPHPQPSTPEGGRRQ